MKNFVEKAIHEKGGEIRLPADNTLPSGKGNALNFAVRLVSSLIEISGSAPETLVPAIFVATGAWSAYLLESKAIAHTPSDRPTEPRTEKPEMRVFLLEVLKEVENCVLEMRNLAILDKTAEKARGETDPNVRIPKRYTGWRDDVEYETNFPESAGRP